MSADAQVGDQEKPQAITLFSYTVDGFNILLERDLKTEIVERREIFPIPQAPSWCSGMVSLRGKLIPVLNLHQVLSGQSPQAGRWLLIVEALPLPQIAISIDNLPIQRQVLADEFDRISNASLPNWLTQQCLIAGNTFYQANHHMLFEQLIQANEIQQNALEIEV